jgi:hypothetical protein
MLSAQVHPPMLPILTFFDSCSICVSPMHSEQNCPSAPVYFEYPMEQVNTFNDYRKQSNGPYFETYNPGWKNHLNFSWKQN